LRDSNRCRQDQKNVTVELTMPLLELGASRNHGGDAALLLPKLARLLGTALGTTVTTSVAPSYELLLERLLAGKTQVAWLPPLLHARATRQGAKLAAVPLRGGWLTYRSALLVRKDQPVVGLSRMRGLRAAWVDRSSGSGYVFPRLELSMLGAPPERVFASEDFFGSAAKAGAAVAAGEADVCACFVSDAAGRDPATALQDVRRAVGDAAPALRVLHVTEPIPPDGFVLSAKLTGPEQTRVTAALLALHETLAGRDLLRDLLRAEKLSAVTEAIVRSLRSWMDAAAARDG
jgi:phosphonate transport system substrate-binding protein